MEKEYSVTIEASFGVMAESKEGAEKYILSQFYNVNTAYSPLLYCLICSTLTDSVEVDNGKH